MALVDKHVRMLAVGKIGDAVLSIHFLRRASQGLYYIIFFIVNDLRWKSFTVSLDQSVTMKLFQ